VDIISSSPALICNSMIPSSLSYSSSYSSSSSASASSTNSGTVFLPIQVTRSQQNNHNNIIFTRNEDRRGYRYVQKQSEAQNPYVCLKSGNHIQPLPKLSVSKNVHLIFFYLLYMTSIEYRRHESSGSSGTHTST
jgi:hypothetical protein